MLNQNVKLIHLMQDNMYCGLTVKAMGLSKESNRSELLKDKHHF